MANTEQHLLNKKNIFRYLIGIGSGIILCILAFLLYDANLPLWCIFLLMGIYCAALVFLIIVFYQRKLTKIDETHRKQLSVLRHDVKGILSPALLMADRILLQKPTDEKISQSAESIAQSIEKVAEYLKDTKK